ncbi:hypothetical protein BGW37DRAFT_479729 [Umbelopsis sp. PMI_123]|nr:hypothetical protein BGW37DRAFT_479729 [Umbelopsis sp. PMI_123]
MSATAESNQSSRRSITVITQKNLPAHLRQTQPYDPNSSTESSPLLSPPPPYQQFEQGSEYTINTHSEDVLGSRDGISRKLSLASSGFYTDVTHTCNHGLPNCSSCSTTSLIPGILPSPFPSSSTPIQTIRHNKVDPSYNHRPRRHSSSVNPQDPGTSSLYDSEDESEALDRISDILSHLIKEASDAVNGIDRERTKRSTPKSSSATKQAMGSQVKTPESIDTQKSSEPNPKSKFPVHKHLSDQPHFPHRRRSIKSMPPPSHHESYLELKDERSSSHSVKRRSTGSIGKSRWSRGSANKETTQTNLAAVQRGSPLSNSFRDPPSRSNLSVPASPRMARSPRRNKLLNEPLIASYKRIDDSLAMVDSLSRDLAAEIDSTDELLAPKEVSSQATSKISTALTRNDANESLSLVVFLLVQGIHSVLAFLSGMLSLKPSRLHLETIESDTFYNALSWAFTYTMGNVLVDQCIEKAPVQPSCRDSIPGEYRSRSPSPPLLNHISSAVLAKRQQWAVTKKQNVKDLSMSTSRLHLEDIVPCVSQSSSILEKRGTMNLKNRSSWRDSDNAIERLVVHSPTRRFHNPVLDINEQEDDGEEEVLQVVAVKRIRKTGSIRGNGVRILERRNST